MAAILKILFGNSVTINSGTVHLHVEFDENIFPQYWLMIFHCKTLTGTLKYGKLNI